jgi:hypothetical protein
MMSPIHLLHSQNYINPEQIHAKDYNFHPIQFVVWELLSTSGFITISLIHFFPESAGHQLTKHRSTVQDPQLVS